MKEINAILTISYRDVMKFLRDRSRLVATFIFPVIFIVVLGGSFQSNLGKQVGFDYLSFVFTGVIAQTLFQSSAAGIISLIEDREDDFSQEIFVSPISRYSIIIGKIVGESIVSLLQGLGIVIFALIIGVHFSLSQLISMIPVAAIVCVFGGAFGVLVMSQLGSQRAANQIFPFVLFPQIFLSGVFSPMKNLPIYLFVLSRISPMLYAVDFLRNVFYWNTSDYAKVIIYHPALDLLVIVGMFLLFIIIGTYFFVRSERNK